MGQVTFKWHGDEVKRREREGRNKGLRLAVEHLLGALPEIASQYPNVQVLLVGPPEPIGEAAYRRRLAPLLERHRQRCRFLGMLPCDDLPAFLAFCNVLVLPSVNSTDSYGMVQLEAAICGTPVVARDLPADHPDVRADRRFRSANRWPAELPGFREKLSAFDSRLLGYPWRHPDPCVDRLQRDVQALVARGEQEGLSRREVFAAVWRMAHHAAGRSAPQLPSALGDPIPHLSEPWYCCAEPTEQQLNSF